MHDATPHNIDTFVAAPWVALVALWYAIRASGFVNPALVPSPHAVAAKFVELAQDRLPMDMWMSTRRVFTGVALGVAVAVPVGFAIGWYRSVRTFVDPLINFFRALPPIARGANRLRHTYTMSALPGQPLAAAWEPPSRVVRPHTVGGGGHGGGAPTPQPRTHHHTPHTHAAATHVSPADAWRQPLRRTAEAALLAPR